MKAGDIKDPKYPDYTFADGVADGVNENTPYGGTWNDVINHWKKPESIADWSFDSEEEKELTKELIALGVTEAENIYDIDDALDYGEDWKETELWKCAASIIIRKIREQG